jgi:RNA polymerase sigma-70 factor (ECF subfamily)
MTESRLDLEAIFFTASQKPPEERAAYLDQVCGADPLVRQRVERFLRAQETIGSFLERPPPVSFLAATADAPATGAMAAPSRVSRCVMASSETQKEFAALLARVRQGEAAALTELIQLYEPDVWIAARVRLGPALRPYLDLADVVQSVHYSLISGLQKQKFDLASPEKLVALAVAMVRRKIARHWRSLKRQTRSASGAPAGSNPRQALLRLCTSEHDPGSAVRSAEAVDHFLQGLDDIDRRLLELRMDGYSTTEAARQLGVDAGCLRVRLGRLRKRLLERGLPNDWL